MIMIHNTWVWASGNIAFTEIAWVAFGLIGFYFAFKNFRASLKDVGFTKEIPNTRLARAIALGHARTEGLRMLIHSVSILIGSIAMILPPANPDRPISPLSLVLTVGLFMINAITVIQSILDGRLRKFLDEQMEVSGGLTNSEVQAVAEDAAEKQAIVVARDTATAVLDRLEEREDSRETRTDDKRS